MNRTLKRFAILNTGIVGVGYVIYTTLTEINNQKLYKSTTMFKEAMNTLKSHSGAVQLLGDFIEAGRLTVLKQEEDNEMINYHVKVAVRGTDRVGNMYFWLSRKDEDSDAQLNRIELQLKDMKKRLLILDRNKLDQVMPQPAKP